MLQSRGGPSLQRGVSQGLGADTKLNKALETINSKLFSVFSGIQQEKKFEYVMRERQWLSLKYFRV